MSDSEDYDSGCGGSIVLTEEESARIDALSAAYSFPTNSHLNSTLVSDPMPPSIPPAAFNAFKSLTPFQRYRPNGRLSVTDLVAPTWCEVQFEYGLQQRRSRKLETRPRKFTTRHGKEIAVEKHTAVANDVKLKSGNAVHNALEREIHPERIRVEVQTEEELWARKFLDMLACIQSLTLSGICREFPVVGFVHGQLVAGVIDEIKRFPSTGLIPHTSEASSPTPPSTPSQPNPKRRRGRPKKAPDSQSSDSEASSSPVNSDSSLNTHSNRWRLFLSDNKTRFFPTLPSHSATLASRLQLMLYRNLLNDLISMSAPFDFSRLWQSLNINPLRTFSDSFLAQTLPLWKGGFTMTCLEDLERQWKIGLPWLNLLEKREDVILPVHERLTLVYRLRDTGSTSKRKKIIRPDSSSGDEQFQKALLESIQAIKPTANSPSEHALLVETHTPNATVNLSKVECDTESVEIIENTDANGVDVNLREASAEGSEKVNGDIGEMVGFVLDLIQTHRFEETPDSIAGSVIGQVQFDHDQALLDSHVANVLDWWHGKREPLGVTIEEVKRCHTCEYISGCEWREKMAMELVTK